MSVNAMAAPAFPIKAQTTENVWDKEATNKEQDK